MKTAITLMVVLAVPHMCFGWFWNTPDPDWDGLKVTWGSPFSAFHSLPRTRSDALSNGWTLMVSGVGCNGNPKFVGDRYWKDSDLGVILIFDASGYIAGIQAGIRRDYPNNVNNFPSEYLIDHPMVLDGDIYYITAYFVDPASVCVGRTSTQYTEDGTGTGLWIQNGTNPVTDSITVPKYQRVVDNSAWTKGKCFYTMGVHYWYNVTKDMSCDRFYPIFLMYNGGELNAFGWAFGMNIETSQWLEHPPQSAYSRFLSPVPDCLRDRGTMSTLHIYMTNSPSLNFC